MRPKLIVFASGTKDSGGSGFENLVQASRTGILDADIAAVVSNHGGSQATPLGFSKTLHRQENLGEHGGVRKRAERLGVPFVYFGGAYDAEHYKKIVADSGAEWVALSGWLKMVKGLEPRKTFNIHPALLSQLGGPGRAGRFGGANMYGHRVHEAVKVAFDAGEITESGCTMHFVTDEYDRGPVFFEYRIPLRKGMTAEEIAKDINISEHEWQPKITNMVVHGEISWDGKDLKSLVVPEGYKYLPKY